MPPRHSSSDSHPTAAAGEPGSPLDAAAAGGDWRPAALLIGTLAYLYFFYAADIRKLLALRWLLIPDIVLSDWIGGDATQIGLLDRIPILFAAGLILLTSYATGRLMLPGLGVASRLTRLERTLFSLGVGLNLWSLYTLAIGLAGGLQNRWLLFAPALPVAILTAAGLRVRRQSKEATPPSGAVETARGDSAPLLADATATDANLSGPVLAMEVGAVTAPWWSRTLVGCTVLFALVILFGSVLPPWHFDVREYHLQVPKEWFRQGTVEFMPHNVYGNMPLGAEMHTVLGMALMPGTDNWWWGALVGKAVIGAFGILTALAVFAVGRRFLSMQGGIVGACAFLSTPWIVHTSTTGLIEGAVAFYFILTVHAILIWREGDRNAGSSDQPEAVTQTDRPQQQQRGQYGLVVLAGFLAGAAVACKYPSLLFLVIPALLYLGLGTGRVPQWRAGLLFLLAVTCASGPWFGKNLVLTGNPTYPLLYEIFDGTSRTPEKDAQWTRAHRTPQNKDGSSFTVAQLIDSLSQLTLKSQFISPLLLPMIVAAWASRQNRWLVFWWTAFLLFGFSGWWLLTHRLDRFLLPLLPVACLLVAVGATWSPGRRWQWFVKALMVWTLVTNLLLVTSNEAGDNRYLVSLQAAKVVSHPGHAYLNAHVQPGHSALLVGDAQAFNVAVPVLYNTCFDDCWFELLFRDRTTAARREVLRHRRISHVLVDWFELNRYRSPGNYGYSDYVTRERLQREFVDTGLLRPVDTELVPEKAQMYEVVGWRTWDRDAD